MAIAGLVLHFLYVHGLPVKRLQIKGFYGLYGLCVAGHFYKSIAFGPAGFEVPHHGRKTHVAVRRKEPHQVLAHNVQAKVENQDIHAEREKNAKRVSKEKPMKVPLFVRLGRKMIYRQRLLQRSTFTRQRFFTAVSAVHNPFAVQIFVSNLQSNFFESDIRRLFSKYGEVEDVVLARDGFNNRSLNRCFVTMPVQKQAEAALLQLQGADVQGKKLKVSEVLYDPAPSASWSRTQKRQEEVRRLF